MRVSEVQTSAHAEPTPPEATVYYKQKYCFQQPALFGI